MTFIEKLTRITLLLMLCINSLPISANAKMVSDAYAASISIIRNGTETTTSKALGIDVYEIYSSVHEIATGTESYEINLPHGQQIAQQLRLPAKFSFIRFRLRSTFPFNGIFLLTAGDKLKCQVFKDSVVFTGIGAAKMNLQYKLEKIINSRRKPRLQADASLYLGEEQQLLETEMAEQLTLLEKYKSELEVEEYEYLRWQCIARAKYRMIGCIKALRVTKPVLYLQALATHHNYLTDPSNLFRNAPHYAFYVTDYLYEKEKMGLKSLLPNPTTEINTDVLLDSIKLKYVGGLKEKMLLLYYIEFCSSENINLSKSLERMLTLPMYREMFSLISQSRGKHMPAYNFSLPDSTGKVHNLKDFEGKVLVLDFWFTGCMACEVLAVRMKDIIHNLKDEKVVFVTISVDAKREIWIKSLKKGKYTHPEGVNLYTDGKGYFHPILKHYNIWGYPHLIIIDKQGKVIDTNVEIPRDPKAVLEFISLIRTHLK